MPEWVEVRSQEELDAALARPDTIPVCLGDAEFAVGGEAVVRAGDAVLVRASNAATVEAWGTARVEAADSVTVAAWASARVTAGGSASVEAWDHAEVLAGDSAAAAGPIIEPGPAGAWIRGAFHLGINQIVTQQRVVVRP